MKTQPAYRNPFVAGIVAVLALISVQRGCAPGRQSHHEMDHVVPAYWPISLADAADKLEQRLAILSQQPDDELRTTTEGEVTEILGWLPEVAGDTELSEASWLEIYVASAQIKKELRQSSASVNQASKAIGALCLRLRVRHAELEASTLVSGGYGE